MRPAGDPRARFGRERHLEVRFGVRAVAEQRSCRTAFVVPERRFAEHPLTLVARESREAVVQRSARLPPRVPREGPSIRFRSQRMRFCGYLFAESRQLLQCVVVASFAVVEKDEGEPRLGLVVAGILGGSADQLNPRSLPPPKPARYAIQRTGSDMDGHA